MKEIKNNMKIKDYNLLIASHNGSTFIILDGKVYGDQIVKVTFEHEACGVPTLILNSDDTGDISPIKDVDEIMRSFIEYLLKGEKPEEESAQYLEIKKEVRKAIE